MTILTNGRVRALLMVQAQVITRGQLLECGVSRHEVETALRTGVLLRLHPGVYTLASVPPSWTQSLWAARLAVDTWAAISHEAAARTHGYATYAPWDTPTLLVPHGTHPRAKGAVIHETRDPWLVSVMLVDNLLVTTPERTFCDLAATTRRGRLALVLDDAKVEKLVTYESVGLEMQALARHGKPGFATLKDILDERGPGHVPPNKALERKTMSLFDRFGGPRPRVAWPYPTREQVGGCADFGYADALLAVETDGRRWHQRIADAKRDHERDANAARHGVQVLRVLYEHVVNAPEQTWSLIVETYEVRMRQLGHRAG